MIQKAKHPYFEVREFPDKTGRKMPPCKNQLDLSIRYDGTPSCNRQTDSGLQLVPALA